MNFDPLNTGPEYGRYLAESTFREFFSGCWVTVLHRIYLAGFWDRRVMNDGAKTG